MTRLNDRSVGALLELLRAGTVSSVEVTRAHLEAIEAKRSLNAFISVDARGALTAAAAADATRARGDDLPLLGVPIAVKDIFVTKGQRTTCGSRYLDAFTPPFESTATARLRAAGAVLLGKTNMDEFAMGSTGENSAFGPCLNPHDPLRVPGGSSGGSAAAVAAGLTPAALGTDTGGSVRQPAAFCGVVGFKPTYGRISRFGMVAFASSLDTAGILGRRVEDAARLLQVLCGHDPRDATSSTQPVPDMLGAVDPAREDFSSLRIGVPREYFVEGMSPEVERSVRAALERFERRGATLVDVSLPHTRYTLATYYLLCTAEASSNLARFDGVRYGHRAAARGLDELYERSRAEGFGAEVKRRIMLGTFVLSEGHYDAYYDRAQRMRTLIKRDFDRAFERCDVLATPTTPSTAPLLGELTQNPLEMYLSDIYTTSCNLAGLPGVSLPCGVDASGMPIGLQLMAPAFDETTLLNAAASWERCFNTRSD